MVPNKYFDKLLAYDLPCSHAKQKVVLEGYDYGITKASRFFNTERSS